VFIDGLGVGINLYPLFSILIMLFGILFLVRILNSGFSVKICLFISSLVNSGSISLVRRISVGFSLICGSSSVVVVSFSGNSPQLSKHLEVLSSVLLLFFPSGMLLF
jgi:hypothetical protein